MDYEEVCSALLSHLCNLRWRIALHQLIKIQIIPNKGSVLGQKNFAKHPDLQGSEKFCKSLSTIFCIDFAVQK